MHLQTINTADFILEFVEAVVPFTTDENKYINTRCFALQALRYSKMILRGSTPHPSDPK